MRVGVTGASGHVGGAIVDGLLVSGHDVVSVGRTAPRHEIPHVEVDLGHAVDVGALAHEVGNLDTLVHAAACLAKQPSHPALVTTNVGGTLAMLDLVRACGGGRMVYISGVPVIGRPVHLPIDEAHPLRPMTTYHATKAAGEHLCSAADDVTTMTLRLTSPVGPGTPPGRILTHFVAQAVAGEPLTLLGDGGRRQDYVDVRDVAELVEATLDATGTSADGIFNVAAGRSTSNRELAERIVAVTGSGSTITYSGEPDPDEEVDWTVSIDRAREMLEYRPSRSLDESIAAVVEDADRSRS